MLDNLFNTNTITRRDFLKYAALTAAALAIPGCISSRKSSEFSLETLAKDPLAGLDLSKNIGEIIIEYSKI